MKIQRISAFSQDGIGGNPAGVVIADSLPTPAQMQQTAAEVGYAETAFATRHKDGFMVRYYAPTMEVPFCGHATIALGAALGAEFGAGTYPLYLSLANIKVDAITDGTTWGAQLTSPPTSQTPIKDAELDAVLDLFGWSRDDLGDIPATYANGGADHVLLFLNSRETLAGMRYDFDRGLALMKRLNLVTINCLYRETHDLFHARNAFASGGVVEDPATGAAAAALAGYLRDQDIHAQPFTVLQGFDMGSASRLNITPLPDKGAGILVAGATRNILDT